MLERAGRMGMVEGNDGHQTFRGAICHVDVEFGAKRGVRENTQRATRREITFLNEINDVGTNDYVENTLTGDI